MKCHHASPEEAVQMHVDLRARRSVGMHWGTWALAAEPLLEPPARLAAAVAAAGLPAEDFVTVQVGRWFSVPFGSSSAAKT
jgi:N-acyl-phosphatidylethanolamine-hydrolysing phospholipase D